MEKNVTFNCVLAVDGAWYVLTSSPSIVYVVVGVPYFATSVPTTCMPVPKAIRTALQRATCKG